MNTITINQYRDFCVTHLTPHFHLSEFCGTLATSSVEEVRRNTTCLMKDPRAIVNINALCHVLEFIRNAVDKPLVINSGYRAPWYNKKVGGAANSFHLQGLAADISTSDFTPEQMTSLRKTLACLFMRKILVELKYYPNFVHIAINKSKFSYQINLL